jgi:hypothetical protein
MEVVPIEDSISRMGALQLEIPPPWSGALGKGHNLDFSSVFPLVVELQESARSKPVRLSGGAQEKVLTGPCWVTGTRRVAGLVEFWTRQQVWRRVAVAGRGGGGGYGGGIPASIPGGCHPY